MALFMKGGFEGYVLEHKFDGFRCLLIVDTKGSAALWTRERKPIAMPDNLQDQVAALNLPAGTVLDGEIWTPTKRGSWRHDKGVVCNLTFWDVIRAGSEDVSQERLEKRHDRLVELLGEGTENVRAVEQQAATPENLEEALRVAKAHRDTTDSKSGFIHGVVLKRLGSPRRDHPTRSTEHPDWVKIVFDGMESGQIR